MNFKFLVTLLLPMITGLTYFIMAREVKKVEKLRSLMFGEIGFKKFKIAFIMIALYFISRPIQNMLGDHPLPLIVNCVRQFFLMAIIAPSFLLAIFHWVPTPGGAPHSTKFASYALGTLMGVIFVLLNTFAIDSSKLVASIGIINFYDPIWFQNEESIVQLVAIHLICQLISPVGFLILAVAYIKHRRHNYELANVYNMMTTKWRYLEMGIMLFAGSFIAAGSAVLFGSYYAFVWTIYFVGAIIAGLFVLKSIKLPPRKADGDLA
jgi:hypothetical protein